MRRIVRGHSITQAFLLHLYLGVWFPSWNLSRRRAALWRASCWLKLSLLLGSWEKRGRESWVPGWPSLSLALWVWRSHISSLGLVSVTLTWYDSIFPSYLLTLHSQDAFSWFSSIPGGSGTVGRERSFRAMCQKSGLVSEIHTLLNRFPQSLVAAYPCSAKWEGLASIHRKWWKDNIQFLLWGSFSHLSDLCFPRC